MFAKKNFPFKFSKLKIALLPDSTCLLIVAAILKAH